MKKLLRAAAASGVAASTLLGGLALGPAAVAAPAPAPGTTGASVGQPFTLVVKGPTGYNYLNMLEKRTTFATAELAKDAAQTLYYFPDHKLISDSPELSSSSKCLATLDQPLYDYTYLTYQNLPCNDTDPQQRFEPTSDGNISNPSAYAKHFAGATSRFLIRTSEDVPAEGGSGLRQVRNGGLGAAASGPTALTRGTAVEVPFAVEALEKYVSLDATVKLTAPAGTKFAPDQQVMGQWADEKGTWNASGDLGLSDVEVSADGKQLTGEFHSADGFAQWPGYQLRWFAPVVADADATAGEATLRYEITGSTNLGDVRVDGTSPTTLDIVNGGLAASPSSTTTLQPGESTEVPFALKATGAYHELRSDVTLTAPAGTTFDEGQTVAGEWADEHGTWHGTAAGLELKDVRITEGGTKLTGRVESPDDFEQYKDWQLRWHATVTASTTAAPGDGALRYEMSGSTNRGTFTIDATSATTIAQPDHVVAPPVVTEPAAGSTVTVSRPAFTGTGEPGATIRVGYGPNSTIGTATVQDDGSWTLTPTAGLALGTSDLLVTQTAGTDVQTIHHEVVRVPATIPFAVTSHVDGQSYAQGITTFSGTGTTGSTVEARNQWGTLMGKATVGANGTWSFDRNLGPTTAGYDITFTQTTPTGDTSTASLHLVYTGVLALEITKPADGSTYTPGVTTFEGRAAPNAVVTATNQWGTRMGRAVTGLDGTWRFDRNLGPTANYEITFVASKDGKTQSTVLHLSPEVTKAPVTVTSIADGDTYRPGLNVLAGTGTPGATVKAVNAAHGWNVPMGQATVGADGRWQLPERNWGPSTDYQILVTQTDPDGSTSSTTVTVKAPRWQPLVVTTPTAGDTYESLVPVHFSGTSTPYATITVRSAQSDTVYRTVEADSHGNWSFDRAWGPSHTYTLIFDQEARDGQTDSVTGFVWAPRSE